MPVLGDMTFTYHPGGGYDSSEVDDYLNKLHTLLQTTEDERSAPP